MDGRMSVRYIRYIMIKRGLLYLVVLARGEPRLVVPFLQRGVAVRLEGRKALSHEVRILRRLQLPLGGSASTCGPLFLLVAILLVFTLIALNLFVFLGLAAGETVPG